MEVRKASSVMKIEMKEKMYDLKKEIESMDKKMLEAKEEAKDMNEVMKTNLSEARLIWTKL